MPFFLPSIPCTGCGACVSRCPADALTLKSDTEGFLTPVVNEQLCADCGECTAVCPADNLLHLVRAKGPACYACWNKDEEVRRKSASGGMFSVYAGRILADGGVVYGTAWRTPNDAPIITRAETLEELAALRSSKYVQADPGTIYRDVSETLKSGRKVLFAGTPCQVAGLYAYLGGDAPNLWTCDLVCHGVPSPALYKKWAAWLSERLGGKLTALNMRGKSENDSHSIQIEAGDPPVSRQYSWSSEEGVFLGKIFLKNIALRKSCHQCRYSSIPRLGDITLGDFWGLGTEEPFPYDKSKGVSLNLVNTVKGEQLAAQCRDRAEYVPRPLTETKANLALYAPVPPHPDRDDFLRKTADLTFSQILRKYRKIFQEPIRKRVKRFLKKLVR